jgi:hypothetical protein
MKQNINMVGGGFQHDICSSANNIPKAIEWVKDCSADISIHIDHSIFSSPINKNKKNYAWIVEAKNIIPNVYETSKKNISFLEENYELIFTHDQELVNLSNKFRLALCNARTWITNPKIQKKTKLISMIASSKVMCSDHVYRQQIIKKYQGKLDHFGKGFKEISKKEQGLSEYCFSIAMENGTYPVMFSEKITDCFAIGSIPIYYGTDTISNYFNKDGIIMLTDNFNIDTLSYDYYESKLDAVKDNFERTINLPIAEDYLYESFIK